MVFAPVCRYDVPMLVCATPLTSAMSKYPTIAKKPDASGMRENVTIGVDAGSPRNITREPRKLQAIHATEVRRIIRLHRVEPDEVHAAVVERVILGAEVVSVHATVVERMRFGHVRPALDDAEMIMVARHRPVRRA